VRAPLPAAGVRPAGRRASKLRLALLIVEGHLYLAATILVFAGVFALLAWGILARRPALAIIALFLGVPLFLLTAAAVRSLFFRMPWPEGLKVSPQNAPALLAMVEEVRRALQAPPIHQVLIGTAFTASIVQVPRLAMLWPRNVLTIGYPLLALLSAQQLKAVVAHELAHVFHSHGLLSGWVWRTHRSWMRLTAVLQERSTVPIFVRWIQAGYVPRLSAQSRLISRDQEFVADLGARSVAGSPTAADALVVNDLGVCLAEREFWPAIFGLVESQPEPPEPFSRMQREFAVLLQSADTGKLLDELLREETDDDDTHPSLRDRLRAIGEAGHLVGVPLRTAGEEYLGSHQADIARQLDEAWQERQRNSWRRRHALLLAAHERLAALEALPAPTAQQAFERATVLEELERDADAADAYRAALAIDANHSRAALAVGRLLLDCGDDQGAALVERAMAGDASLTTEACGLLADHLEQRGRYVEAAQLEARARRHATHASIAQQERTTATALDRYVPHGLAAAELSGVAAALDREPEVGLALLVRKQLSHGSDSPMVFGLVVDQGHGRDLPARLHGLLPADAVTVVLDRDQKSLRQALEAVPGAVIYVRSEVAA
jgi:Zn-dependent protease with chaperone function/tetratricopeptide (TPR) repeat protein